MVQGENVNRWGENQVLSLFLVALVIFAVSSLSDLPVLHGGQICFPFTDYVFASFVFLLQSICLLHCNLIRIWRLPQGAFLACLALDCSGISL